MSNRFQLFIDSSAFEEALFGAIETSQTSFYAQFMTFEGDASGERFASLMKEKAEQGLDARLIVDYYSDVILSDTYPTLLHRRGEVQVERSRTLALFDELQASGAGVKRTAPPGRFLQYMLYRNHKKMVVLDNKVAFVGGINVSDHNYDWHDFMVRIEGPLVQSLVEDFCGTWQGQTKTFDTPTLDGDFILNQCSGRYSIHEEIIAMINRAEKLVVIESPYLIGHKIEGALRRAAEREVKVQIIMPYRSNKLVYRIWVRKTKQNLNHPNIAIYGFQGNGGMTHAKLVVVDNRWATFGSLNIMELEGLTQQELNVFTSNTEIIGELNQFIATDLAQSVRLAIPRYAFGRFTYTVLYRFFNWWTQRLVRNKEWRERYC